MPNAEDFARELKAQIDRARRQGRPHVEVNAGELHRTLGGYPGDQHRMPVCCAVMRKEAERSDTEVIYETDSGTAPALTIRYMLSR